MAAPTVAQKNYESNPDVRRIVESSCCRLLSRLPDPAFIR
jgi:hypothetical protein